jgi:hypothetical protein
VQAQGAKSFLFSFPSKEELEHMIAIGSITNKEGTIAFAQFTDDVQPIKVL